MGGSLFTQKRRHIYVQKKRGQCRSLATCGQNTKSRNGCGRCFFDQCPKPPVTMKESSTPTQKRCGTAVDHTLKATVHTAPLPQCCRRPMRTRWLSRRKKRWLARRYSLCSGKKARHTRVQNTTNTEANATELNCQQHKFPLNTGRPKHEATNKSTLVKTND